MNPISNNPTFWMAAALLLAGCGQSPTAPAGSSAASAAQAAAMIPDLADIRIRFADGFLRLEASPAAPWAVAPFEPSRPGGWCFQLFINSDQQSTGYGPGIDYLVRAIEVTPGGGVDVRMAEGGGGPGGWGAAVGRVGLQTREGQVECAIPLELLGRDDGAVDFVLEVYRTVALPPESGGGVKHEFVANYSGTSAPYLRQAPAVRRGYVAVAPEASRTH